MHILVYHARQTVMKSACCINSTKKDNQLEQASSICIKDNTQATHETEMLYPMKKKKTFCEELISLQCNMRFSRIIMIIQFSKSIR